MTGGSPLNRVRTFGARVLGAATQVELPSLPRLAREVSVPVYMIHNSADAEDYFFIFDFEEFVEQTRIGVFVRPRLEVWAGRLDFTRHRFARQFRESFAREFEAARAHLAQEQAKPRGWFGFFADQFRELRGATLQAYLANLMLLVATTAGTKILAQVMPAGWLAGKSDTQKLEASIGNVKAKVDEALAKLEIRVHPQLCDHAMRVGGKVKRSEIERDAWPLPHAISAHLEQEQAG
jgi:hypothetical protein